MISAFGVDHGEISKGLAGAVHSAGVKMVGRGSKRVGGAVQRLGAKMGPKQGPRVSPQHKPSGTTFSSNVYKPSQTTMKSSVYR